jgi:hypothetical protein
MVSMAKQIDDASGLRSPARDTKSAGGFWRYAPWLSRLILLWPTIILAAIGLRSVIDPVQFGAAQGISFQTPEAVAIGRVGLGAFPLGCALFALWCLVSARRVVTGLSFVAILMSTAIAARIVAIGLDHAVGRNLNLLMVEAVILTACLLGVFLERRRQKSLPVR